MSNLATQYKILEEEAASDTDLLFASVGIKFVIGYIVGVTAY